MGQSEKIKNQIFSLIFSQKSFPLIPQVLQSLNFLKILTFNILNSKSPQDDGMIIADDHRRSDDNLIIQQYNIKLSSYHSDHHPIIADDHRRSDDNLFLIFSYHVYRTSRFLLTRLQTWGLYTLQPATTSVCSAQRVYYCINKLVLKLYRRLPAYDRTPTTTTLTLLTVSQLPVVRSERVRIMTMFRKQIIERLLL